MKVCHITSAHKSNDIRIFKKQCTSLAKAGHEVFLVASGTNREENGVHIIGVGKQHSRLKRMLIDTYKVYKKALEINADIYQIHDPELLLYALKLKRKGKKVIFDSHEDVSASIKEKEYIPNFFRNLISRMYNFYQKKVLQKLDAVITVTPHLVNKLKQFNNNTVMITNYPILDQKEYKRKEKKYTFCFGGGISRQWSHHMILSTLEKIKGSNYVLCGSISNDYLSELKTSSAWENVIYKGVVTHNEMYDIYSQSHIGLALLDYVLNAGGNIGTLGNTKLFEFMYAGLPVICTDFILWKDIIDKYHCGICVNPHDIDSIIQAAQYLLDHPNEANLMGENGRKAVENEFNWSTEEKKLIDLYDKL